MRPNHRPKSNTDQHYLSAARAAELTGINQPQVSKWRNRLKDPEKYRAMLFGAAYAKAMIEVNDTTAAKWTGDPESYTPAKYIEAAREPVMTDTPQLLLAHHLKALRLRYSRYPRSTGVAVLQSATECYIYSVSLRIYLCLEEKD